MIVIKEKTRQRIFTFACLGVIIGSLIYVFSDGAPLPMPTPYTISTVALESGSDNEMNTSSSSQAQSSSPASQAETTLKDDSAPPANSSVNHTAAESSSIPAAADSQQEASSQKININTATAQELTRLSGIGDVLAERIVEYRTKNGMFKSIDELLEVSGIGEKKLSAIRDNVTL